MRLSIRSAAGGAAVSIAVFAGALGGLPGARASTTGSISGSTFQDTNRNGVRDAGEPAMANQQLYLFDGTRTNYIGTVVSDGTGRFAFPGLADGDYSVEYAPVAWDQLKYDWVPTTTSGVLPRVPVHIASGSAAAADFGWRPITRSTTLGSPMSSYVGPSGLRVESYTDAISAKTIHDALAAALVGAEAPYVTVRFDYGSSNTTTTGVQQANGQYTSYSAVSYVTYGSWLTGGDQTLTHEYGHAWSLYYAHIVQQDPTLAAYIQARGLTGDSRLDTSYTWSVREMIAEDYRQLFGSANAASRPQANQDVPPAATVAGLKDWLRSTFTAPPASGSPAPAPAQTTLAVTGVSMSPQPVSKSGTASFTLSASASVTVRVVDSRGSTVRTLASGTTEPSGSSSLVWDRKDASGRRAKSGTYRLIVDASTSSQSTSSSTTFTVN